METRAHYVAVGAFVLVVIFLAFGAVLWLGRVEFSKHFDRYYIFFKGSVEGLGKGSSVQYNGIPVGRVTDVQVDPDNIGQIQVTVEIDTSRVVIKTDARAFLDTNILSGVATVQIRGGTEAAAALRPKPGHHYPIIPPGQSALEEVKASLPELTAALKIAAGNLNALLNPQNRQAIGDSLQNIRTATGVLAAHSQDIGAILDNANASVLELRSMLHTVAESYSGRGGLKDQASQTLADYDRVAKKLIGTIDGLERVIADTQPAIRDFTQQTLPGVNDLVASAQQLAINLNRLEAEIERDPTRLLFGDRRVGYRPR
ncbi:MAG TPA: MlaD family protein [Stellaceae bacterium]|nr:MlaD family protein [Stellaceae bacterium]